MENKRRLIDAEKLETRMGDLCDEFDTDHLFIDAIIYEIGNAPTMDVAEVVHGRWVHVPSSDMMTGKAYICSECKKMRYGSFVPNYCQNCGAKMDK